MKNIHPTHIVHDEWVRAKNRTINTLFGVAPVIMVRSVMGAGRGAPHCALCGMSPKAVAEEAFAT